jgi:hypothetical protein
MTVRIDWFGFAEGVAVDTRGSITLVGFSPAFLVHRTLPAKSVMSMVLYLIDDEDPEPVLVPDATISLDLRVIGPDGKPLVGAQQTSPVGEKRYPQLPGSTLVVVAAELPFREHGLYLAEAALTVGDSEVKLEARRNLHILPE